MLPRALQFVAILMLGFTASLAAQTTTSGSGVDVEIYDPTTGLNEFCVAPGDTFWANVFVRPGTDTGACTLTCGSVNGGTANLATGIIDLAFNSSNLVFHSIENNAATAAVDGLTQLQNLDAGRVGWALAGDWTPDATPSADPGALNNPCEMAKLTTADWAFRVQFTLADAGPTDLHLRREAADGFALSFADACAQPFRESNTAIDQVVDAIVRSDCTAVSNIIFRNGFETGDTSGW